MEPELSVWAVAQNWDYLDMEEKYKLYDALEQADHRLQQPLELQIFYPDFHTDVYLRVLSATGKSYNYYLTPQCHFIPELDYLKEKYKCDTQASSPELDDDTDSENEYD